MKSLFRYPGGKANVAGKIAACIPMTIDRYAEPFLGGGAVLVELARTRPKLELFGIEKSRAVWAVWNAILNDPVAFAQSILEYQPSVLNYLERKHRLKEGGEDPLDFLIINRCSHSGRGGGPIGGMDQSGEWKINARWNGAQISHTILTWHQWLKGRCHIICADMFEVNLKGEFLYVDPPYRDVGDALYAHSFSQDDHIRLSRLLSRRGEWLLSYNDHPEINRLYAGVGAERLSLGVVGAHGAGGGRRQDEVLWIKAAA